MIMNARQGRGSERRTNPHGRAGYGNTDQWRNDDFRVALIVLLIATGWIVLSYTHRRETKTNNKRKRGWFKSLGFGFGGGEVPSFTRQAKSLIFPHRYLKLAKLD